MKGGQCSDVDHQSRADLGGDSLQNMGYQASKETDSHYYKHNDYDNLESEPITLDQTFTSNASLEGMNTSGPKNTP